jgi:hypothetical protein
MAASQAAQQQDLLGQIITFVLNDAALHDVLRVKFSLFVALVSLSFFLRRQPGSAKTSSWFAPSDVPSKRLCETWFLCYSVFWVACFAVIIAKQLYLHFTELDYMLVCGGLAAPLLLQPIILPSITGDQGKPLSQRHSFKANLWIFVFGFIGNYWYVSVHIITSTNLRH